MEINGKTRLIGLLGDPVEHTLSPVIHNGISERMGMNSVYVPFHVASEGLLDAVRGAYELNILGLNVTVPHKNRVMEYLADMDDAAKAIGAVNTLVRCDGKTKNVAGYIGYNTDMPGLRRQIKEDGISLKDETVVVLGAGGAAKAVVYMCMSEGAAKIYILNRTVEKAKAVAESMMQSFYGDSSPGEGESGNEKGSFVEVVPMQLSDYKKIEEENLTVFQATSIGLHPHVEDVVIDDMSFYRKVKTGVDLIYNPADTRFMQLVRDAGGRAYNALKMLLYQGVTAYELWHGIKVPQDVADDVYVDLKRRVYPKDNIVLIGFMGSGKTTFGKAAAKRFHMEFLDTDAYIEKQAGKSISDIFKERGEEYFRRLEQDTLVYLRDHVENTVFATGGGMPLRKENARLLREIGKVCYLTAASTVIYDRVKEDTNRPLLQCENPFEKICRMMKERHPLYAAACDVMVDTNSTNLEEIVDEIAVKTDRAG